MGRVRRTRAVIALCAVVIVALVLLTGGYALLANVHSAPDGTYVEAPSSVHASLGASATSGHVTLRVNKVADASTREMYTTWERLGMQIEGRRLYNHTLVPPAGEKYLLANITVTNTAQRSVPFSYTDMYLVGRDGSLYYANYAAASETKSTISLVKNHTLSGGATDTMYVLFAVPSKAQATKLVYASRPPIVVNLT